MAHFFALGLKRAAPIAAGYIPVAITYGILARTGGLSGAEAVATSLIVFAGASQFLAVAMLDSGAAQIVVATFFLNFRHLIMSSVIALRLPRGPAAPPLVGRLALAFGLTDEVFAVAAHDERIQPAELAGTELGAYAAWVGGTAIGVLLGGVIPPRLQAALGVALYALFVSLLVGQLRRFPALGVAAAAGAALNVLFRAGIGWNAGLAFPVAMLGGAAVAILTVSPSLLPTGEQR